ncbi:MAG TPA: glycosyltransferase family 2 protein [Pirellulales bacterium]|nr:glycosyltransferase family 2 protein [Pirellulales bacterium]
MPQRILTALPVYNEARYVASVLAEVRRYSPDVLVVDDGSSDGSGDLLAAIEGIHRVTHPNNLGYGAALRTAFDFAERRRYDILVTIDCDGQHEPQRIPRFVSACADADIISGSRYLKHYAGDSAPPAERRRINEELTAELNRALGLNLTDAFCGFKAYRVAALGRLKLTENGYAMPLELWVQAARAGLKIRELPVPLIYLDATRSFGGSLDDAPVRLEFYRRVLARSLAAVEGAAGEGTAADATDAWQGTLCNTNL